MKKNVTVIGKKATYYTIKLFALFILLASLGFSVVNPKYPTQMYLQHSATLLAIIFLIIDLKKNYISSFAVITFSVFIVLHIIGARWIYSYVPYEEWCNSILGTDFHSERNHYDRFVHFMFGVLIFPAVFELAERKLKRWKVSLLVAWMFIQTFSMIYEIFEWMLTFMVSEKEADNYNGQQGDIWDAQKDMVLAMTGSVFAGLIYYFRKMHRKQKEEKYTIK